ncbi:MAG TPA: sigma-54 dependent transcriptional regulator [Terracidiphilus sp.]|jgi:DNA-binding NtrC family response regulator
MITVGLFSEDITLYPLLSSALGKNFQVLLKTEEEEISNLGSAGECDVMILDLHSNHHSLRKRIESSQRLITLNVPAIVMADDGARSSASDLVRNGAFAYCRRPPSVRDLKTLLCRAYENSSLRQQLNTVQRRLELPNSCDRIVGCSPAMQRVYQLVSSVTNLNATILVTGESGTGKELIARAIHNLGRRSSRPFVAVSCGAIPEALIEAELFGHEKGAFTGTVGAREGYFEQANDGTLFLDEIGDLSLFTQVKLLRVLQEMEFSRLGSTRLIPLRARLIFATHRDLSKLVAEGRFRLDLFYRISVMPVDAPPLREHIEDIPMLAAHLLRHYAQAFQKPMHGIDPEALEMLQSYSWPGNVRELENVIQRAIIVAPDQMVHVQDLTLTTDEDDTGVPDSVLDIGDYQPSGTFERRLNNYKVRLALSAIRENHGNKTLAARSLCISRAYLHRLIRSTEPAVPFEDSSERAVIA